MSVKRPKVISSQIKSVNEYLRLNKINSEGNALFAFYQQWLIHSGYYDGFLYFANKEFETAEGVRTGSVLASPELSDYLQFL